MAPHGRCSTGYGPERKPASTSSIVASHNNLSSSLSPDGFIALTVRAEKEALLILVNVSTCKTRGLIFGGKLRMKAASHTTETQAPSRPQSSHPDTRCPTAACGKDRGVCPSTPLGGVLEVLSATSPHPRLLIHRRFFICASRFQRLQRKPTHRTNVSARDTQAFFDPSLQSRQL